MGAGLHRLHYKQDCHRAPLVTPRGGVLVSWARVFIQSWCPKSPGSSGSFFSPGHSFPDTQSDSLRAKQE